LPLSSAFLSRLQKLEASVTFGAVVGKKKKKKKKTKRKGKKRPVGEGGEEGAGEGRTRSEETEL
jgi:hypothetical protein